VDNEGVTEKSVERNLVLCIIGRTCDGISKREGLCEMKKESYFGPHLMLDLSECDQERINDLGFVYDFLNTLPEEIGMQKITQPYVFPYKGIKPEDKGITGFVVIAESHLSVHTFVEKGYAFVDLFSCKPFDTDVARDLIVEAFASKRPEVYMIERGAGFPRGIQLAQATA
jgi:S-adenosylmethionine decarboxylase